MFFSFLENNWCLECQKKIDIEKSVKTLDKLKISIDETKSKSSDKNQELFEIYTAFCDIMSQLTTLLGPNCEIVIENENFLRVILYRLFGNKSITVQT